MKNLKLAQDVSGYSTLPDTDKQTFEAFLPRFYAGFEHPERWVPVSVRSDHDKANDEFLRIEFENEEWLHVKDSETWY